MVQQHSTEDQKIDSLHPRRSSNLIATDQIRVGDWVMVDHADGRMNFLRRGRITAYARDGRAN